MKPDWKQIIVSLLIGLVIGAALGRWAHWRNSGRWDDQKRYSRMVERFSRELNLTPEQKEKVAAILEAKRQKMQTLRAEIRPKYEELRQSTKAEIRKLLIPEQREKFEKLEGKWAAKWERYRGKH